MPFQQATFVKGAPSLADCPPPTMPEFCFAGRSNVGKSSLINRLTNKRRLARTSNTPGKTQQMNYYDINGELYFVDLPGFGFAKAPLHERERWGRDIQEYLMNRDTLHLILHLVDARHKPTSLDEEFFYWLGTHQKPFAVVLTKADKLSGNKLAQSKKQLRQVLETMNIEVPMLPVSAETGKGIAELQDLIKDFIKPTPTDQPTTD
ncbi:MAG: ribosome biogenesis GTP-binding protein YihA/YsxC [Balneolaceae bacterium]